MMDQRQTGYVLLPVVLLIILVATVAFLLNNQTGLESNIAHTTTEVAQARYVAEAGLSHSIQQIQAAECKNYKNLNETFQAHGYKTKVTPPKDSPVSITSEGTLAATSAQPFGASKTLTRDNIRVYQPAIIEILQPGAEGKDTHIYQWKNNWNFGADPNLVVSFNSDSTENSLLQFDLSAIPAGAEILSASLELYSNSNAWGAVTVDVHRVTTDWVEGSSNGGTGAGATWLESDTGVAWGSAGGDYDPAIIASAVTSGSMGWFNWDISQLVNVWVNGAIPNYGLVLNTTEFNKGAQFASGDAATISERPKLTITYACECGVICSGGTPPPVPPPGYFDEFNSLTCNAATDYIGSDGTLDWTGYQWIERDNGDPCSGNVWLLSNQGSNRLALKKSGGWIDRQVDLSSFASATLTFDYLQIGAFSSGRYMVIEASGDGGSGWTELGRIDVPGDGVTYLSASYDIPSALVNVNSAIRFRIVGLNKGKEIYLDNVNIVEGGSIIGPLAHWKLDETSGTIAVDSVGGHDGMLTNGPTWATGQLDGALQFDGTNDYINVPHDATLSLTDTMTFIAWVNASSYGASYQTIVAKDSGAGNSNYYFGTWQQELVFGFFSGPFFREVFTTGLNLQPGTWYQLAASFDNATDEVRLYVDGVEVHNGTLAFSPAAVTADLLIGKSPIGEYWRGLLDDVRIYDSVLPAAEIADLYSGGGGGGGSPPPSTDGTVFEEFTEAALGSDGKALSINKPTGTVTGDLLIVAVATDGQQKPPMTAPAGWALINHDDESKQVTMDVLWKIAGASEPASYDFSWAKSQEAYGWIMRFTGHDPVSPINVSSSAGGSSNSPTSPAVTTTVANTMILRIGGFDDDDITAGDPGLVGHTAITMGDSGNGASTASGGAGYMTQAVAGDSGTADFSLTATEEYRAVTIGIAPAP